MSDASPNRVRSRSKPASSVSIVCFSFLSRASAAANESRSRSASLNRSLRDGWCLKSLMEGFIEGIGITQNKLVVSARLPPRSINEIVHGKRGIAADTELRLEKYIGVSSKFWLNLQTQYEASNAIGIECAERVRPVDGEGELDVVEDARIVGEDLLSLCERERTVDVGERGKCAPTRHVGEAGWGFAIVDTVQ